MKVLLLLQLRVPFVTSHICITISLKLANFCFQSSNYSMQLLQSSTLFQISPFEMATIRNKRKLTTVARESQKKSLKNSQSQNSAVPRITEEWITQVLEEIEGRVTKKLSQQPCRIESWILGALTKLDEFLLDLQVQLQSGTVPETSLETNWGSFPECPEVDISVCRPRSTLGFRAWGDMLQYIFIWHNLLLP